MPALSHRIALNSTPEQAEYFARAAGCDRFVWNWALAEWLRQYQAGMKPNAMALKKQFNAIKYAQFPWMRGIHRDAHAQAFAHLAKAWAKFFKDIKSGIKAHAPVFKKKGQCRDSFYVANDKLSIDGKAIRLPVIGNIEMREALRFDGKILGATVSRTAARWFVSVQVELSDEQAVRRRTGNGIIGVDLGLTSAATLSTGEKVQAPKPLKAALRRLRIRARRLSRKVEAAKAARAAFIGPRLPGKTHLIKTNNRYKNTLILARLHARIASIRGDFLHKLTTRLCRENQAVGMESLNVKGMQANEKLARALSDVGLGEFARQMRYKAPLFGTELTQADMWYPSSKLMSCCGHKLQSLGLGERSIICPQCKTVHDRDHNAAINLLPGNIAVWNEKRLATATALPVASKAVMQHTSTLEFSSALGGKVTPVRHEAAIGHSGQEIIRAHFCARV